MSVHAEPAHQKPLRVIFLRTKSHPQDAYEDYFAGVSQVPVDKVRNYSFEEHFIPVLEHKQNATARTQLRKLLEHGELKNRYGGMIFTSQRAVEAWFDIVKIAEEQSQASDNSKGNADDAFSDLVQLTPFPLYVVGPATERALQTLLDESRKLPYSAFMRLNPSIHGAQSGNGANLAKFILKHYNQLHQEHWFTYFEAPRLPFIPLLGMSSQNYGRKRLDPEDPRLQKKPLCFLVGEIRRDVIPRTLQANNDKISVDEIEVYATDVMASFGQSFESLRARFEEEQPKTPCIVVVFSPQGSDIMLRSLGYIDTEGKITKKATQRWYSSASSRANDKWIVAAIGPTTRDYLREKYGFEVDVCAGKPSPEGLMVAIETFLNKNGLVT